MSVRPAAVAGTFYPESPLDIQNLLSQTLSGEQSRLKPGLEQKEIIGGIVPHAGYNYSAKEAVHFFHCLKKSSIVPETVVIINPSHTGIEKEVCLDVHDAWNTPLGEVSLDTDFMDFLNISRSSEAHRGEHAAEVVVPYLQYFLDHTFSIVPITMRKQSYKNARVLAEKIFKANQVVKRKLIVIASSDFSHYERPEVAFYNDNLVINRILNNSIHGLYETIHENKISVCGYGPIMTLMFYARMIHAGYHVEMLARGNSSVQGNDDTVVDYVSAAFYRS